MNKTTEVFISLLRSAINGKNEKIDLCDVNYEDLYSLSKFHDLAHIVYNELRKYEKLPKGDVLQKFKHQFDAAKYRFVKRETALSQIRELLDKAQIPFVLLKGSYLMNLYPEKWMRTSSDIDILVDNTHHKSVCKCFENAGWKQFAETSRDVSFAALGDYHVEVHHTLAEDDLLPDSIPALDRVWDYCEKKEESYEYIMRDEMFYYYHIAHTAKHFKCGGCGVRPFVDLWLLNHAVSFDDCKRKKILGEGNLCIFEEQSVILSEKWFSDKEDAAVFAGFEEFIVNGGIYGTMKQKIAVKKNGANHRKAYYFKRVFPPYRMMKHGYPILKHVPLLLPLFWIIRWLKFVNPQIRKKAKKEMLSEKSVKDISVESISALMKQLEI